MPQHPTNNSIKKWVEDLNRHFSKEEIQMANNRHEKMLHITNHQGNANENYNGISYHLTPFRMADFY